MRPQVYKPHVFKGALAWEDWHCLIQGLYFIGRHNLNLRGRMLSTKSALCGWSRQSAYPQRSDTWLPHGSPDGQWPAVMQEWTVGLWQWDCYAKGGWGWSPEPIGATIFALLHKGRIFLKQFTKYPQDSWSVPGAGQGHVNTDLGKMSTQWRGNSWPNRVIVLDAEFLRRTVKATGVGVR